MKNGTKMDAFKNEIAKELNVDLEKGAQNTSQENGRVGGEMVKRMIDSQKKQMSKSK